MTYFDVQPQTSCEVMVSTAMAMRGTWYSWGGDDPAGFDCSHLVAEALSASGIVPRKFYLRAVDLYKYFADKEIKESEIVPGCLVFFSHDGTSNGIEHVEILIGGKWSIGASGGNNKTVTKEDAIRDNAFVKVRPYSSVTRRMFFVNPFWES